MYQKIKKNRERKARKELRRRKKIWCGVFTILPSALRLKCSNCP